jgi:hypothetical protein
MNPESILPTEQLSKIQDLYTRFVEHFNIRTKNIHNFLTINNLWQFMIIYI